MASKIATLATSALARQEVLLERSSNGIASQARQAIADRLTHARMLQDRLLHSSRQSIIYQRERLKHLVELVKAHNPRRILRLGYSIVTTSDERTLKDGAKVKLGDSLRIETYKSIIEAQVTEINKKDNK